MSLAETSQQIQQIRATSAAMHIYRCLPDVLPLHPGYLDKGVVQEPSLHFSPNSKNYMHNKQQTEKLCSLFDLEAS